MSRFRAWLAIVAVISVERQATSAVEAAPAGSSASSAAAPTATSTSSEGVLLQLQRQGSRLRPLFFDPAPGAKVLAHAGDSAAAGARDSVAGAALLGAGSYVRQQLQDGVHGPQDASWFAGFSDDESTFDADNLDRGGASSALGAGATSAVPAIAGSGGALAAGAGEDAVKPSEWFQESRSGGPASAWQTFYPALPTLHPDSAPTPPWREDALNVGYVQDYSRDSIAFHASEALNKDAAWFDSSVAQYDAFGRARAPSEASERFYVGWEERLRNVTLRCPAPGCEANATVSMFDPEKELHHGCALSIAVHPTDFGDEFSNEVVEWFTANGVVVSKRCNPKVNGCDSGQAAQLFPCAADVGIDHLLKTSGEVSVGGKLSPMVDECPFEGDLLSAVVSVRCLVTPRPKEPPPLEPSPSGAGSLDGTGADAGAGAGAEAAAPPTEARTNATLRCGAPGCEAFVEMVLTPPSAEATCRLTLSLRQTDFDFVGAAEAGSEGAGDLVEEVEWVKVNGKTVKSHARPGRNPCKLRSSGANASTEASPGNSSNDAFLLLEDVDITAQAMHGPFNISAKISQMVDECGTPEGDLLHAEALVTCSIDGGNSSGGPHAESAQRRPMPSAAKTKSAARTSEVAGDDADSSNVSAPGSSSGSGALGGERGESATDRPNASFDGGSVGGSSSSIRSGDLGGGHGESETDRPNASSSGGGGRLDKGTDQSSNASSSGGALQSGGDLELGTGAEGSKSGVEFSSSSLSPASPDSFSSDFSSPSPSSDSSSSSSSSSSSPSHASRGRAQAHMRGGPEQHEEGGEAEADIVASGDNESKFDEHGGGAERPTGTSDSGGGVEPQQRTHQQAIGDLARGGLGEGPSEFEARKSGGKGEEGAPSATNSASPAAAAAANIDAATPHEGADAAKQEG